jgi:serine/threonine protein phosphatase PrpC
MDRWRWASWSDIGDRESNQDCAGCAVEPGRACFVVCDGLGGHAGGARASRVAVDALLEYWRAHPGVALRELLTAGVHHAHRAVQAAQQESEELSDMRTTLVVLATDAEQAAWAHVGDSRFYHFDAAKVAFQTRDHSVPQMLVASGELTLDQLRKHPDRNRLIGTLGNTGEVRPSVRELGRAVRSGDSFLLCSDGFWDYVLESDMESACAAAPDVDAWLTGLRAAHQRAKDDDADNVTVTVIRPA